MKEMEQLIMLYFSKLCRPSYRSSCSVLNVMHVVWFKSFSNSMVTVPVTPLTPCRRATQKCVIALPCLVDGSRISTFSYTLSCTCVWHLIWLTYRFKFIVSLMQDVGSQVTFKRPGSWVYLIKRPSGQQSVKCFTSLFGLNSEWKTFTVWCATLYASNCIYYYVCYLYIGITPHTEWGSGRKT
jgi:hypothetical protein